MHRVNGYLSFRMAWTASASSLPQQQAPPASFRCCLCTLDCVKDSCVSIYASPGCHAVLRPQEVLPGELHRFWLNSGVLIEKDMTWSPCVSHFTQTEQIWTKIEKLSSRWKREACCISTASTQKKPHWWWGPRVRHDCHSRACCPVTIIPLRDFMGHFVNNKKTEQRELLNGQALVWDVWGL